MGQLPREACVVSRRRGLCIFFKQNRESVRSKQGLVGPLHRLEGFRTI